MGPDEMKDLYRRWLQGVWGEGNFELSPELIAEDIVDHNAYRGQPEGRRGQDWASRWSGRPSPTSASARTWLYPDGEFVCGRWTMTGTHTGMMDLFRLPPTGRPVTMTGQEIFRVGDGKLTEVWHQEDVPGMLTQLGLEPPVLDAAPGRQTKRTPVPKRGAAHLDYGHSPAGTGHYTRSVVGNWRGYVGRKENV